MKTKFLNASVLIAVGFAVMAAESSAAEDPGSRQPAAEATIPLTLDDAVRRAIENNPDLVVVRLDTEVEAARTAQTRAAYVPMLSTTLGRSSVVTPPSTLLAGEQGVDVDDWFASSGLHGRAPWAGGAWSASWDTARTTTNSPITSFDPSLQSGLLLAYSQPLLRDRSIDPARQQYIVARRNEQSSELHFREAVVQTVAAVKQAYWTLKAAIAHVDVQQRSVELAEELARQNRIRVDAGQSAPIDLVQAQAEVAQRRENLIDARASAGDAEDRLRRLIMQPSDASFWQVRLDPIEDPSAPGELPDVEAAVDRAMTARYDLARAGHDLENARTEVELFANQKLPDVRVELSYRGSGLAGTEFLRAGGFPGTITGTRRRGFDDALGQTFTPDYPAWSVGVTVGYALGRSYEDAGAARAAVERRQAEQRIASLRLEAAETVRRAGRQIRSAAERMDAARAGATLARERLDVEQRRYEVGLSTTFLVTQAQRDLLEAEVGLLRTALDHESALVHFDAVQQAPPQAAGEGIGVRGGNIVPLAPQAPRGLFRPATGAGF
jgi:outer membrane protein TolC